MAVRYISIAESHAEIRVSIVGESTCSIPLPAVLLVAGEQGALLSAEDALRRNIQKVARVAGSTLCIYAAHASEWAAQTRV